MNKYVLFLIAFFSISIAYTQIKSIKGVILDETNYKPVVGVIIEPDLNGSSVVSNKKGKFKITLPYSSYDTLVFSHHDYYSFIRRVKKGENFKPKPHTIFLKPQTMKLDTVYFQAFNENKLIIGQVTDLYGATNIEGAEIFNIDGIIVGKSGFNGYFRTSVPCGVDALIFSHADFKSEVITLKPGMVEIQSLGEVEMIRLQLRLEDTIWSNYRNSMAIAINEITNGGIALRYQRYFGKNQSLGLYATYYLGFGIELIGLQKMSFDGYKVSLAYRRFTDRKLKKGLYGEARISGGYFNFGELYSGSAFDGVSPPDEFYNFGLGIGGGFFTKLAGMKRGFLNFYLGLQYFPIYYQEKGFYAHNEKDAYVSNYGYWYSHGPGSIVEIKIIFGGLF